MRLLFLFFAFYLARLDAASPATFPAHIGKERLATNAVYTGRCTTSIDKKVTPVATFKLTINTHSVNIIKRGYDSTSHIGVMINNPNPSTAPKPLLFAAGGFGSTQFGGSAAAFLYKPGPVFFALSEGNTHYILDYDFVKHDYVATDKGGQSWYSLAEPTLRAHWPKFNGKPYGPRPAERFIVVIALSVAATMKEGTQVEQLQQAITQNYQGVVDNFVLIPGTSTLGSSTVCSVSLFVDYDIYWDVWVLVLSISVSVIAITLVSVFKCCPCASVKRIYYKQQSKGHSSDGSITAEPTDAPLDPIASEDTLGLADDSVDASGKMNAL
ncbi:hypothetical protein GL50803_0010572 [Giardia duodenalis]|uniref:Uncharacterized protein n=1 Tax=Giardia intestinalis (strain ATCC 50803 / WB clone C6) TaxID=184922 RepID=A8BK53_GIAIC|nr:hypothetical protein GL50803_0010572 [Giardia intestinalis]KAE8301533.1 hypothetical protein GL50803_0010572 [Giardia intestinalis]|eukprot:XP_001706464.1 Hypothetical protein GL50803_10572 [Giardia lamblia ATCC 50803]